MARQVKCPRCSEYGDRENMVEVRTEKSVRWWHAECRKEHETHANQYKSLIEFVCQLFGVQTPPMNIVRQIQKYHTEYGWSYLSIQIALEYFFVILDKPVGKHKTIGIVPYIYDDAKDYFIKMRNIVSQKEITVDEETIKISTSQSKKKKRRKNINFDDL